MFTQHRRIRALTVEPKEHMISKKVFFIQNRFVLFSPAQSKLYLCSSAWHMQSYNVANVFLETWAMRLERVLGEELFYLFFSILLFLQLQSSSLTTPPQKRRISTKNFNLSSLPVTYFYVKLRAWGHWRWVLTQRLTIMPPDFPLKLLGNDKLHQASASFCVKVG